MYGSSFSLTYLYFSALAVAWGRCDIIFYGYNNHLLSSYKIFLEKEKKNKNHFASPDPQHPTSLPGKQLKIWFPPILSVDGERSKKEKKRKEKAHNNNAVRTTVKQKHKIRKNFFFFLEKQNLQFSLGLAAQPSHIAGQIVQFVVVVGIRPFIRVWNVCWWTCLCKKNDKTRKDVMHVQPTVQFPSIDPPTHRVWACRLQPMVNKKKGGQWLKKKERKQSFFLPLSSAQKKPNDQIYFTFSLSRTMKMMVRFPETKGAIFSSPHKSSCW